MVFDREGNRLLDEGFNINAEVGAPQGITVTEENIIILDGSTNTDRALWYDFEGNNISSLTRSLSTGFSRSITHTDDYIITGDTDTVRFYEEDGSEDVFRRIFFTFDTGSTPRLRGLYILSEPTSRIGSSLTRKIINNGVSTGRGLVRNIGPTLISSINVIFGGIRKELSRFIQNTISIPSSVSHTIANILEIISNITINSNIIKKIIKNLSISSIISTGTLIVNTLQNIIVSSIVETVSIGQNFINKINHSSIITGEIISPLQGKLFVADNVNNRIYTFIDRELIDNIQLDSSNSDIQGIAANNSLIYTLDSNDNLLYAYDLDFNRVSSSDISIPSQSIYTGLDIYNNLIYVSYHDGFYVYNFSGERQEDIEFELTTVAVGQANTIANGYLYVLDATTIANDDVIRVYSLSTGGFVGSVILNVGAHEDTVLDFPRGMTYDGTHMIIGQSNRLHYFNIVSNTSFREIENSPFTFSPTNGRVRGLFSEEIYYTSVRRGAINKIKNSVISIVYNRLNGLRYGISNTVNTITDTIFNIGNSIIDSINSIPSASKNNNKLVQSIINIPSSLMDRAILLSDIVINSRIVKSIIKNIPGSNITIIPGLLAGHNMIIVSVISSMRALGNSVNRISSSSIGILSSLADVLMDSILFTGQVIANSRLIKSIRKNLLVRQIISNSLLSSQGVKIFQSTINSIYIIRNNINKLSTFTINVLSSLADILMDSILLTGQVVANSQLIRSVRKGPRNKTDNF